MISSRNLSKLKRFSGNENKTKTTICSLSQLIIIQCLEVKSLTYINYH